ncbi:hemerythrin domain-containing protein [Simplicispira suum]|uniref:Hemerythrin n=1 Tax=Simplicispira suum TaxID=2109915 RepID=A0A2S0N595_9BURK|nr:hemerythrin domain-containing protein [Simplicispira suum]AVO43113.1 hemerythrin [Simplicispira suum]MBW7833479.1 hemerythrin domain-containing protein [Simplicispira suum]
MNIDKFKDQHVQILQKLSILRELTHGGVIQNATQIARSIMDMSSTIKLHLAAEDMALYPALQRSGNAELTAMSNQLQKDMGAIAAAYEAFARQWSQAEHLRNDEAGFRRDANEVLRTLHQRVQRENTDFYPRIEAL